MNCSSGKVQHETLEEAAEVAAQMKERYGDNLTPYFCGECFTYHTGHSLPPRVRKYRAMLRRKPR